MSIGGRKHSIPPDIERETFDLVVIGAGFNGTGVARDAALRGLRVLLLDKGDFASGTSGRSGRMIHGGLRYLEHRDFRLVRESLRERHTLLRIAPHLTHPQPLLIPLYRGNKHRRWQLRLGLAALDAISILSRCRMEPPQTLSARAVLDREPGLNPENLLGGCLMPDAYAEYAERLCVENTLAAVERGATAVAHAEVIGLDVDNGVLKRIRFRDRLEDREITVQTRYTVNVAGPWVDFVLRPFAFPTRLVGGTKGSFIAVDPFPGAPRMSCFFEALSDRRQMVVLPWNSGFLIGTTDIRYDGDPDTAVATDPEIDYFLAETNRAFPRAGLTRDAIRFSYAGVRPLPRVTEGAEGSITRKHILHDHAPGVRGLLSVVGGKLSTYRQLAEDVVDAVFAGLGRKSPPCQTAVTPLPGAAGGDFDAFRRRFRERAPLPEKSAERLLRVFGARAGAVLDEAGGRVELLAPFDEASGAIGAEIPFAVRAERAETLVDILVGRSMVAFGSAFDPRSAERALEIARDHLGWDAARRDAERSAYQDYIQRFKPRPRP